MSDGPTEPTVDDSDREPLTGKAWNPSALFMPSENTDDDAIRRRVRETGKRAFAIIEPINLDDADDEYIGRVIPNAQLINTWNLLEPPIEHKHCIQPVVPVWFPISGII